MTLERDFELYNIKPKKLDIRASQMFPSLARLKQPRSEDVEDHQDRLEAEGIEGLESRDGHAVGVFPMTSWAPDLYTNLYNYWNAHLSPRCDVPTSLDLREERPRMLVATSDLWARREFNVSSSIQTWEHLSSHNEILEFFRTASTSRVGTLAHVVLTRKNDKASSTPRFCHNVKGMDTCDHGHLAVVLQPVYQDPKESTSSSSAAPPVTEVVSIGFFPETGNAHNLNPLYLDNGLVRVPDPMVANWKHLLAGVPEDGDHDKELDSLDGKETDYLRVLKTFVYPPSKMKQWLDVFESSVARASRGLGDIDVEDVDIPYTYEEGFELRGLPYSMYGGVPVVGSLNANLARLRDEVVHLDKLLSVATAHNGFEPLNCATFVLAAFPESNVSCPLGIPAACQSEVERPVDRAVGRAVGQEVDVAPFDTLERGVALMVHEARHVVETTIDAIRDHVEFFAEQNRKQPSPSAVPFPSSYQTLP